MTPVRRLAVVLVGAVLATLVTVLVLGVLLEDDDGGAETPLTIGEAEGEAPQVEDVVGEPAPDFTFTPLGGSEEVEFSALRDGRPAVLNFFAKWCVPCVREMPALEAAHQEWGDRVAFVGLSYNESEEDALELLERTGVTYETGRDPRGDVLVEYGGIAMPTTVFIAADGTIAAHHTGGLSPSEVEEELEALA